jgi:hypothetical protein
MRAAASVCLRWVRVCLSVLSRRRQMKQIPMCSSFSLRPKSFCSHYWKAGMTNGSADRDRCGSLSSLVILFLALIFALAGVIFGLGRRTLSRIAWWEVYVWISPHCRIAARRPPVIVSAMAGFINKELPLLSTGWEIALYIYARLGSRICWAFEPFIAHFSPPAASNNLSP